MTVDEARCLKIGDHILYQNERFKVLHTKECRNAYTNEIYITLKCSNKDRTVWLPNDFASYCLDV